MFACRIARTPRGDPRWTARVLVFALIAACTGEPGSPGAQGPLRARVHRDEGNTTGARQRGLAGLRSTAVGTSIRHASRGRHDAGRCTALADQLYRCPIDV